MKLAENDDMFRYPVSNKKELYEIAEETGSKWKAGLVRRAYGGAADNGAVAQIDVVSPDGQKANVNIYPHADGRYRVAIDASGLVSGQSQGSQLTQLVLNYAYNNGWKFEGDRVSYTPMGEKRALEHMLSSALRFQTTRHLAPSHQLLEILEKDGFKWQDSAERGLTAEERAERDYKNISQLIDITYKNVAEAVPEIREFRYNIDLNRFEKRGKNGKWQAVKGTELPIRADSEKRAEKTGTGRTTIARAVLVQSINSRMVPGEGQAGWNEILDIPAGVSATSELDKTAGRHIQIKDTPLYQILYQKKDLVRGATEVRPNRTFNIKLFEEADLKPEYVFSKSIFRFLNNRSLQVSNQPFKNRIFKRFFLHQHNKFFCFFIKTNHI